MDIDNYYNDIDVISYSSEEFDDYIKPDSIEQVKMNGPSKLSDVYLFSCRGKGNKIVNAITRFRTSDEIGSLNENLYFTVIDSRSLNHSKEPYTFYFDSPTQYENFMINNMNFPVDFLKTNVKNAWYKKRSETLKKLNKS
jgi:hypothetical protein